MGILDIVLHIFKSFSYIIGAGTKEKLSLKPEQYSNEA